MKLTEKWKNNLQTLVIAIIIIALLGQVGLRIRRLIRDEIPIAKENSLWEKRVASIRLVFGTDLSVPFIKLIEQIPDSIAFKCHFKKWPFTSLFQYWFYPRSIGSDNRLICYFNNSMKKLPKDYRLIYQDSGNKIIMKESFYQSLLKSGQYKKWEFLLGRRKE